MDNQKIGRLICERRKKLGLTQQELADCLQITNKAVSKWETGEGMPDVQLLQALSAALELSVDELLAGEALSLAEEESEPRTKTVEDEDAVAFSLPPIKVLVLCLLACASALGFVILRLHAIFSNVLVFSQIGDSYYSFASAALMLGDAAFWGCTAAIFILRVLRMFGFRFTAEKNLTVVTLIGGILLSLLHGQSHLSLPYCMFWFGIALMLGSLHGYRVPFKIFGVLCFVSTLVFGAQGLYTWSVAQPEVTQAGFIGFNMVQSVVALILFWLLEKYSYEYDRSK